MTILIPGRFQPFHAGHAWLLEQAFASGEPVILALCAAEDHGTPDNPWTAPERIAMIQGAIHAGSTGGAARTVIVLIRDIHDPRNWVAHVDRHVPTYDEVWSGNPETLALFEEAGHRTRCFKLQGEGWSGTAIRQGLAAGTAPGELPLPSVVADWLGDHGGWPLA